MPSAFRTPKTLTEWLRLDYFRYPRRLPWLRRWLCWATLVACVAALGAATLFSREARLYQAGPLSPAHAMITDCGQCHQESFTTAQRFLPWNQSLRAVPDSACLKCHDGPVHSDKLLKNATENCASCHQEHRGHATLARLPDARCLSCHSDLKAHSTNGEKCTVADIRGFPEGHVPFRSDIKESNNLRFNHWKHVNLNVAGQPQLDCAKCHEYDDAGRYMRPIKYEAHCASCHPLSVQLGGTFEDQRLNEAANAFAKEPAPHLAPRVVRGVLRERLFQFVEDHPLLAIEVPAEGQRGKPSPKAILDAEVTKMHWDSTSKMFEPDKQSFVQRQLALSEQLCFDRAGGCALCHIPTMSRTLGRGLPEYAETKINSRWFPNSRFDHRAHRMLSCTECHAMSQESVQLRDVKMPEIKTCAQCHSPAVGARSDCVECHTYHPRGHGLDATRGRTIAESLRR